MVIVKNFACFYERDPVLTLVRSRLFRVPFKIRDTVSTGNRTLPASGRRKREALEAVRLRRAIRALMHLRRRY